MASNPCNCGQSNKERATYGNMKRLAEKAAKIASEMYVIIRRNDGTYTFEPLKSIESKGEIQEYIHYL